MTEIQIFDDMRPYYDHEANAVLQRVIKEPIFMKLINYLWPEMTLDEVLAKAQKVNTAMSFQVEFMHPAIRTIVERSATELTCSGFENLDKKQSYLFVANHRDILLDSAMLQVLLVEHGFDTSEITFGDNLMEKGFITDFGRLNRMFTVLREGTGRELYDISKKLSSYIRHTINEKKVCVWIAQRNGRAKDGNDQTQTGLIKMLNMSGTDTFSTNFAQLRLVPVTVSYEYEPCDALKVQELYLSSLHSKYVKAPGEDINSVITGAIQQKGRIHLAIGKPIINELDSIENSANDNERVKELANLIDQKIYNDYKLYPINYVAHDLLENTSQLSKHYSTSEKENFIDYINTNISKMKGEPEVLFNLFLKMYATPVKNKILQTVQV